MTSVWAALQASDAGVWIGFSRWGYAVVATLHVLSIATLFCSVLTLDLRLMGLARSLDPHRLARLVVIVAATGLFCAAASGALLFVGRAATYAAYDLFRIKMALIAGAVAFIAFCHLRYGRVLDRATPRQRRFIGMISISLWVCVVVAGRMIAFVYG